MPVAIITGVSSGLGKDFFAAIVKLCPEIDEFWIIARRKEKLAEIRELYPNLNIIPIPLDLLKNENFTILQRVLKERAPDLKILVNNAGFGKLGDFFESEYEEQISMTKLNVTALTAMTALAMPYMSDGSLIVNVSSIASFTPTPGMAVYSATKAYVTAFTKALWYEARASGIGVIAVCPGPMDTEFNSVAGIGGGASPVFESLPKDNPAKIAERAIIAGFKGKPLYTGKLFFKFYRLLSKILPHSFLMRFTDL